MLCTYKTPQQLVICHSIIGWHLHTPPILPEPPQLLKALSPLKSVTEKKIYYINLSWRRHTVIQGRISCNSSAARMRRSMVFHQVIATKMFHINELSSLVQTRIRPLFIYVVNAIMVLTIQDLSKEKIFH